MSSAADEQGTATEQAPPGDEVREGMLAKLQEALGDAVVGSHIERGDLWVRVRPDAWRRAAEACKAVLDCDHFCFLSGIDWRPVDLSARRVWDEEATDEEPDGEPERYDTGYAGGDTRFQVFARFQSTDHKWGVTVKADLDDDDPRVESIIPVYRGANWHEREAWEMYGFNFDGHPDLRHIYLPAGFEGNPLRKDFPLLAREVKPWPGLVDKEPMPGEEEEAPEEADSEEAGPEEAGTG